MWILSISCWLLILLLPGSLFSEPCFSDNDMGYLENASSQVSSTRLGTKPHCFSLLPLNLSPESGENHLCFKPQTLWINIDKLLPCFFFFVIWRQEKFSVHWVVVRIRWVNIHSMFRNTLLCSAKLLQSCQTLWPCGLQSGGFLSPWDSPGKLTGMACHAFLHGIFPTQGWDMGLLHLLSWDPDSLSL